MIDIARKRNELGERGYCVIPKLLNEDVLSTLGPMLTSLDIDSRLSTNFSASGGFVALDYHDSRTVSLLAWPATLELLGQLGATDLRLHSYYVTVKPPGAASLQWHSDIRYRWNRQVPPELFVIYGVDETTVENGCLRVLPGSHRREQLAYPIDVADTGKRDGEVAVTLLPGDAFIGDRRLLHATFANATDLQRTCVTVTYVADYRRLPAKIRALVLGNPCLPPPDWHNRVNHHLDSRLLPLLPTPLRS